jgi:protein disulfide-isomerase A4
MASETSFCIENDFIIDLYSLFIFSGTQYWRNKVVEVANDYPGFTFAIADEEEYSNRLKDFGLDDSGEDVNVALLDEKERKYKLDDEFSEDSLRDFLDAYKNG